MESLVSHYCTCQALEETLLGASASTEYASDHVKTLYVQEEISYVIAFTRRGLFVLKFKNQYCSSKIRLQGIF